MIIERKIVLYEGIDEEESKFIKTFLEKREIKYNLRFGRFPEFRDLSFPIVSEGMIDYCGLEAIERYFSR